ncbi:MAG: transketolase C-terminal domain-containing protein, partial [Flavobacteriales bacterium]|nr:transketolase C-terminal domain-containing protein [Flavobacteriales bacterium]
LIDRAGIVGADGATHHGIFDLAYLLPIPNMTVLAPMDATELEKAIATAYKAEYPVAVRYPRGEAEKSTYQTDDDFLHTRLLKKGTDVAVISVGDIGLDVEKAISLLDDTKKNKVAHFDLRIVKPLDESTLKRIFSSFPKIITVENGITTGGAGENITAWATKHGYHSADIKNMGVGDFFPSFGSIEQIKEQCGISVQDINTAIKCSLEKV